MYQIFINDETTICHSKQELLQFWTQLLLENNGKPYKIVHDEIGVIIDGVMSPEDMKVLERITELKPVMTCQNGACAINYEGV